MTKELKALNEIKYGGLVKDDVVCFTKKAFEKRLDLIETALKRLENYDNSTCNGLMNENIKLKEILRIIKENVMPLLSVDMIKYCKVYPIEDKEIIITQDEYNLLKEWLK